MDLITEDPAWQVLFVEFWPRFAVWRVPMRQVIAWFISGEADRRIDPQAVPDTLLGDILGLLVKGMAPLSNFGADPLYLGSIKEPHGP